MKIKCEYCGSYINDSDEKCPNCGATNEHLVRNANESPKTIEELKQWYKDKNLPSEEITRFFIGRNYKNPKAFGIYKDEETGNFVVYKNKADGTRAIRYEGKDEQYAVNELYLKLKSEIANQKARNANNSNNYRNKSKKGSNSALIITIAIILIGLIAGIASSTMGKQRGYYLYNNNYYYYQNGFWYLYDTYSSDWQTTTPPEDLKENYSDYYTSSSYDSDFDISSFEDSSYYIEPSSSSDWDSSSSWDSSDSWDSGGSDWDSDW